MLQASDGRAERTASRFRREDLAIRTVAVSLKSALREIRRTTAPEARVERIAAVIAWARESIRFHERAVSSLEGSATAADSGVGAALDSRLDDVREVLRTAERALDREVAAPVRR